MTAPDPDSRPVGKAPRWRRIITGVLIVLSCVLAPLSAITIWARNQVLNTDRYVRTVTPLAANPAIQNTIVTNVTNALFDNVDVGKAISDALPKQASFLADPIDTAAHQFVMQTTQRFVQSSQFQQLWKQLNRRAHEQVVKALTGQGKAVTVQNGKVYLDLSQVVVEVKTRLAASGFGVFQKLPVGKTSVKLELFDAGSLEKARRGAHLLDQLRILLPVLVFVFLGLGLLSSPNRRRTLVRWGLGFAGALTVLLAGLIFARSLYLNAVANNSFPRDAAQAAYDILFHYLKLGVRILAAAGLVVATGAYLAGPGRGAVAIRSFFVRMFRGATAEGGAIEKATAFVARWRVGFRIGGVALAALVILVSSPSATAVLVILILLAVYLLLVEWFIRAAPPVPSAAS